MEQDHSKKATTFLESSPLALPIFCAPPAFSFAAVHWMRACEPAFFSAIAVGRPRSWRVCVPALSSALLWRSLTLCTFPLLRQVAVCGADTETARQAPEHHRQRRGLRQERGAAAAEHPRAPPGGERTVRRGLHGPRPVKREGAAGCSSIDRRSLTSRRREQKPRRACTPRVGPQDLQGSLRSENIAPKDWAEGSPVSIFIDVLRFLTSWMFS